MRVCRAMPPRHLNFKCMYLKAWQSGLWIFNMEWGNLLGKQKLFSPHPNMLIAGETGGGELSEVEVESGGKLFAKICLSKLSK